MEEKTLLKEKADNSIVSSVKSDVKRELELMSDDRFEFDASDMANSYSGNPELWCLWYSQILSEMFTGLEMLFNSPVRRKDDTVEDGLEKFTEGFNKLIEKGSERTDSDTAPLVRSREKIQRVINEESDSVTLVIQIKGGECSLECVDGFVEDQLIEFTEGDRTAGTIDEASLAEHSSEVSTFMNGYSNYRRRPQNKYKRTLTVSVQRSEEEYNVTVGVDEIRTRKYSVWEQLLSVFGEDFSSDSYIDFVRE